jgi:hypothetical protein
MPRGVPLRGKQTVQGAPGSNTVVQFRCECSSATKKVVEMKYESDTKQWCMCETCAYYTHKECFAGIVKKAKFWCFPCLSNLQQKFGDASNFDSASSPIDLALALSKQLDGEGITSGSTVLSQLNKKKKAHHVCF